MVGAASPPQFVSESSVTVILSRTDGIWLGVRYSDCGAAVACMDELHPIEENKLIVIVISPSDKLGGADEYPSSFSANLYSREIMGG